VDIRVSAEGFLEWSGKRARCALGRSGILPEKREGDGGTPNGAFPLRRILFRADRLSRPASGLAVCPIEEDDGWCDDPSHPAYNQPVKEPFAAGHERLWRADGLYDVVVVLGYNDDPIRPGSGSAIFLHVARPDYGPTEGCVAIALDDLLNLLRDCRPGDRIVIAR
jgi:L,D-peptidoglycan transpeptidase YkuD (ErfK/YbiS/YcfS/YnhG family)